MKTYTETEIEDAGSLDLESLPLRDLDDVADRILPGGRLTGHISVWLELEYPFSISIPWPSVLALIMGLIGGRLLPM